MKLDDRDIVCETDYSPLSNEELAAQIEWHAAAMSGVSAYDLERITGPARALLARAEADEAEVVDLHRQLVEMATAMEEIEAERLSLAARVAELEAASELAIDKWADAARSETQLRLDAAEARVAELESQLAAQGWRPVTEKPDKPGWYVVYDSDGHVFYNADIFPYRVARWTGKWDSAFNGLVDYWRPLPPAPQETTP